MNHIVAVPNWLLNCNKMLSCLSVENKAKMCIMH